MTRYKSRLFCKRCGCFAVWQQPDKRDVADVAIVCATGYLGKLQSHHTIWLGDQRGLSLPAADDREHDVASLLEDAGPLYLEGEDGPRAERDVKA